MTAGARTEAGWPSRIARHQSTCPNCIFPIYPGTDITKPPGRAWQHQDCPAGHQAYRPQPPGRRPAR